MIINPKTYPGEIIAGFDGPYSFLSNFYAFGIVIDNQFYPTTEHYYQAMKCSSDSEKLTIINCSRPGRAKKLGKLVKLRSDWDDIKIDVMTKAVATKFSYPEMRDLLLSTNDKLLIELNTWNDRFWGMTQNSSGNYVGENKLGSILMKTRSKMQFESM